MQLRFYNQTVSIIKDWYSYFTSMCHQLQNYFLFFLHRYRIRTNGIRYRSGHVLLFPDGPHSILFLQFLQFRSPMVNVRTGMDKLCERERISSKCKRQSQFFRILFLVSISIFQYQPISTVTFLRNVHEIRFVNNEYTQNFVWNLFLDSYAFNVSKDNSTFGIATLTTPFSLSVNIYSAI